MVRPLLTLLSATALLGPLHPVAGQAVGGRHAELGVYGIYTSFGSSSTGLLPNQGWGARAGFTILRRWRLEAWGDFIPSREADGARAGVTRLGVTALRHFAEGRFAPYGGFGYERLAYRAAEAFDDNGAHVVAGTNIAMGGRAALRLQGKGTYYPASPLRSSGAQFFNLSASAGISIQAFGGPPRDSDEDGVGETADRCVATQTGAWVDASGCPRDSDVDGVLDGLDLCGETPAGAIVGESGCPIDSDGDSIVDGIDQCTNTPAGAAIDETGCHLERSTDVSDGLDACEHTPVGDPVDLSCAAVHGGDSIPVETLLCPDVGAAVGGDECRYEDDASPPPSGVEPCETTPAGRGVDAVPCPLQIDVNLQEMRDPTTGCDEAPRVGAVDTGCSRVEPDPTASSCTAPGNASRRTSECDLVIQPENPVEGLLIIRGISSPNIPVPFPAHARLMLDGIVRSMMANPDLRVEVSAHSDGSGTVRESSRFTRTQADAVKSYLVSRGVDGNRIEAVGYGPDRPLATNLTPIGRATNRRIEIKHIRP